MKFSTALVTLATTSVTSSYALPANNAGNGNVYYVDALNGGVGVLSCAMNRFENEFGGLLSGGGASAVAGMLSSGFDMSELKYLFKIGYSTAEAIFKDCTKNVDVAAIARDIKSINASAFVGEIESYLPQEIVKEANIMIPYAVGEIGNYLPHAVNEIKNVLPTAVDDITNMMPKSMNEAASYLHKGVDEVVNILPTSIDEATSLVHSGLNYLGYSANGGHVRRNPDAISALLTDGIEFFAGLLEDGASMLKRRDTNEINALITEGLNYATTAIQTSMTYLKDANTADIASKVQTGVHAASNGLRTGAATIDSVLQRNAKNTQLNTNVKTGLTYASAACKYAAAYLDNVNSQEITSAINQGRGYANTALTAGASAIKAIQDRRH